MHRYIGADARLAFRHETALPLRRQKTVDHTDIMVVKHQSSAGEYLDARQPRQGTQLMLQEAVHAFGRIHHRLGDDVGIAQRTDHVGDLRQRFQCGQCLIAMTVDAQPHQYLAVVGQT